jgi:hypothetical protein
MAAERHVLHDRAAERRRAVALTRPRRSHKLRDDGSLTPAPAFCGMADLSTHKEIVVEGWGREAIHANIEDSPGKPRHGKRAASSRS